MQTSISQYKCCGMWLLFQAVYTFEKRQNTCEAGYKVCLPIKQVSLCRHSEKRFRSYYFRTKRRAHTFLFGCFWIGIKAGTRWKDSKIIKYYFMCKRTRVRKPCRGHSIKKQSRYVKYLFIKLPQCSLSRQIWCHHIGYTLPVIWDEGERLLWKPIWEHATAKLGRRRVWVRYRK